eukprot:CAMPEP_0117446594 /NCGR_PEP_ID=MMETSP0759-20121206/6427_1 /TAXON_ID=63605 /ORGANISM="Percolomonas cosmopolitus, Strain WS" /LENGTH=476 /DNA_ID=CAMNT_0005238877 /DNA_START=78 /DNA_END=1509 /DNA_ORIENTATION=+
MILSPEESSISTNQKLLNNAIETTLPPESELFGGNATNVEEIQPDTKNIIFELMKQVRIGMDLTKVMIPVDFLEPQSLLERITVYARMIYLLVEDETMRPCPQDDVQFAELSSNEATGGDASKEEDIRKLRELNVQRMIRVVRWYLSGWHIRPPGVKKPYNPILGEFHRCRFDMSPSSNSSQSEGCATSETQSSSTRNSSNTPPSFLFLAEQVSHHPPISAFYAETLNGDIIAEGWYYPKSKFLGNSAASEIQGELRLRFPRLNQTYVISWPTVYARGIIFGRLVMEIGGECTITCPQNGVSADISFKNKPFIGGEYNCVSGKVYCDKKKVATFKGRWDSNITLMRVPVDKKSHGGPRKKGKGKPKSPPEILMNCATFAPLKKTIPREEFLMDNESIKVWPELSKAVKERNLKEAQDAKYNVEEAQREKLREREKLGKAWQPKYFSKEDGFWTFIGKDSAEFLVMTEKENMDEKMM